MGVSIEVDNTNFATEVLKNSHKKPVLVDFYATWCGPCKMLKPILEKLATEYDFILAKVDVDQSPDLAQTYNIEGVPDVRVVTQGEVKPGFVGVLSEPKLRNFLGEFNLHSELEKNLQQLQELIKSRKLEQAKNLLDQLFHKYPNNVTIIIEAAKFLVSSNKLKEAKKLIDFAKKAGCSAVKFQYHLADHELSTNKSKIPWTGHNRYEFIKEVQEFKGPF